MALSTSISLKQKYRAYFVFTKFRLSFSVILSALAGYLFSAFANNVEVEWPIIANLMIGGILVTAASNGSNQIWERDLDKLMKRTERRPIPQGMMTVNEGFIVVAVCLFVGTYLLYQINLSSAILGVVAYVSYVFIYTPMKRVSPWAVFVGAFPGAIPPMLGAIAAKDDFGLLPGILFFVQFMWQFPHFWAIAWVVYDDYKAAGFSLLPSRTGRSKESAFQIIVYALAMIPFSLLPWVLDMVGTMSLVVATISGTVFFLYAYRLYISCETADARKLMFASFVYLPVVQFVYVIDCYLMK
ncbi:MAG: heme o synthase [Cryomorphaceae bacterium]|nr:heme o synthase [Cryomorphaceae bacterium]